MIAIIIAIPEDPACFTGMEKGSHPPMTANPQTNNLEFRGFDSVIFNFKGWNS